jgi:VWFA-related protein
MKEALISPSMRKLLVLAVSFGVPLLAQQTVQPQTATESPAQAYTLKTSVNRVLVDVTVSDEQGNPVHGLGKENFIVDEDGKSQRVLSFDAYNFDKGMDYVPPKLPILKPNTFLNLPADPERGPLYVLLYDLVDIPPADQIQARAQLVKFIENKPEGMRIAIFVVSDDVHLVQGFTSDKSQLLAAVELNGTGPHVPKVFLMGANFGEGDKLAICARLNSIAQYISPVDGRKVLIWFASEFPLSLFPTESDPEEYRQQAKKTLDLFANNQIAVYPVDVSGVVVAETYGPPADTGDSAGLQEPVSGGANHGVSQTYSSFWKQDEIARTTGGIAIYSSNNLVNSLEKVTENGGSYYTLGYSPSNKNFNGQLRQIEVKLKAGKDHLAYRRAYYGVSADDAEEAADNKLSASMKHGAPEFHQLVFEARVVPAGSPERGTPDQMRRIAKAQGGNESAKPMKPISLQAYTVDYAVMAGQLRADGETDPQFDLAAAVYDAEGHVLNSIENTTIKSDHATDGRVTKQEVYRVQQQLDAPLDAKFMRFAVRDTRTGKLGAIEISLPLAASK